jgi:hypothetical protein
MTPSPDLKSVAAQWITARILYPLYSALAREFVIDAPSVASLESDTERPSTEDVTQANQWLLSVDERVHVFQLRQFLQTTPLINEQNLQAMLTHHLAKPNRAESDRDKIDFLLVQFFSHTAPERLEDSKVDVPYVAAALKPVLGAFDATVPSSLQALDGLVVEANHCQNLNGLFTSRVLEEGKKLKTSASVQYFEPISLAAFTRYNFLLRRVFFRLMHQDLNAILDGLRELDRRGITAIDCRKAQFSAEEPVERLRMICNSWKVMFHAEYSSGQPLAMLVDLRTAVAWALAQSAAPAPGAVPKTKAAAAGFAAPDAPEFEVSSSPATWTPDGQN